MPSPKELAKALARQDSVTQQPRNRFLGAIADAAGYVSDQADRYVVPERDPLFGGMRGGDLLPLRNVNRLLDDLSYGGRITTGRGQTTALRPEVVDLAGVTGAMMPVGKGLGKAALREGARQIETGTGVLGRNVIDPRQRMFAGEGAKTADHGALKVAKDMKAAGVPDEQIHAKTKWTFGFADGKPRFEIDDSAAKGQFTHLPPSTDRLAEQAISHPSLYREYPELSQLNQLGLKEAKESGSFSPTFTNDEYSGGSILAKAPNETGIKSVGLHELQHAIQQRENFARGGSPEMFYASRGTISGDALTPEAQNIFNSALVGKSSAMPSNELAFRQKAATHEAYRRLAGEAEARLTQSRMNMTPAERAASYPPSMFDVPVKDQIVRYGDNVGGAMMQRPKTEFEILHDTAQRNAALPVEQGGLGLPANNTYIDRANAPGMFPEDAVHFSRSGGDYTTLDSGKYAIAPFDAVGTHVGTPQAAMERFQNTVGYKVNDPNYINDELKGTSYPVRISNSNPLMNQNGMPFGEEDLNTLLRQAGGHNSPDISGGDRELNAKLRKKLFEDQGYTNIPYFNEVEGRGSVSQIVPPSNIRSRFAAFDPFRRHEADILAGVGVGGMLDPQAIAEALRQQDRK